MKRYKPRCTLIIFVVIALSGCDLPYYWQAAEGQMGLINQRQPIEEILLAESTPAPLKEKLSYILEIREYAIKQLQLEDNQSYLTYADLGRDHVVWNVFATPELSTKNKTWCYPIAGCVSYRGYFSQQDAGKFADSLNDQGFDTYIGGVDAYSTLGWFEDSVLNTFVIRSDTALAALLFHELAHQTLYIKNDTVFNESYANAIEHVLLQRWLENKPQQWKAYLNSKKRSKAFISLIMDNKQQREDLFTSEIPDQKKREAKAKLKRQLMQNYTLFKNEWNGFDGYDKWFSQGLNNAQISTVATYNELLPGFMGLFKNSDHNLTKFISACRSLEELDESKRHQKLKQFTQPSIVYTQN